jgi:hypothetical protein
VDSLGARQFAALVDPILRGRHVLFDFSRMINSPASTLSAAATRAAAPVATKRRHG